MNCTLTSAAVWVSGGGGDVRGRWAEWSSCPPPPFEALSRPGSPFPARLFPNSCHRRDPTVAARGVQDVIVVGRNFRGTTCTRKGTRGPPVLQVCVCVCGLGVPSGGPELDSGVVLSLFHVVPLYAPGLPPLSTAHPGLLRTAQAGRVLGACPSQCRLAVPVPVPVPDACSAVGRTLAWCRIGCWPQLPFPTP
jgi:hypothetical protein